ncbi:PREDICTED: uncharacterized protein LOC109226589 isoform X1 [Nicotiana attenuata]|uniref:Uncharacterized protein n=1 Tax=Nicotiana attenuata TaxID=49451 RepID=A0A1J6I9N2_NICAT|nr:PREDICTED: uncharacterized protein LOC109226589 isoform X1 [Nicotiana attenuata]OIT01694.1 hypothetical protein A4A49_33869 [Nicotiana attenuata]
MSISPSLFSSSGSLFSVLTLVLTFIHGNTMDVKVLQVGQELMKETLPFQSGSRLYELQGLNSNKWYEVKISYPASIPATFTLQLSQGSSGLNGGRKLLNTEKIIFQADSIQLLGDKGGTSVLVNVEPEGIVAIPGVKERKYVIYNIVCDELLFGIPHQAWYVVVLVVLCLALALVIPSFLPPYLLPKNQGLNAAGRGISKDS